MLFRRLAAFGFLLALGSPALAQSRHNIFSVGGSVREDGTHRDLENVLVTVKQLTGPIVNTAYTRANGDFQIDGLARGDYILEVVLKDYEPHRETINISDGSRLGIPIFLAPSGRAANVKPELSISAHQLSVPRKAHDEYEKGMSLIYLKADYRAAITQFELAIRDFPTYYEAFAEEGNAYYQLQDLGHAEEALKKSVELSHGQYADATFTLAALQTDAKHFAEAEATAHQGMTADSSSWRGPFELARALNGLKRPQEAEKYAQQSRDLMPDNPPVYLLLANIHIQKKDYPALLRDIDDYLRLSPTGPDADQARKTRERVQAALAARKDGASGRDEDKSQDDEDDDSDSPADKKPTVEPDTSGLPSLPPPTPGN
jgi:tetratricopeptide (TPR) repeat protein